MPEFSFATYREWIDARFPPNRFRQLEEKMGAPTLYAIGAFIQALGQNPGIEEELTRLGTQARVYVGTGIGNLGTIADAALALDVAQRRWDSFWAERSPDLRRYLAELAEIESIAVEGEVESAKISVLKERQRRHARLQQRWGAPQPPWRAVPAEVVWNIHNTPASQISMLGRITGLTFAPVAACSTFGVALRLALDAIRAGEAKLVVVGATDPPPHPLTVGAFYSARVIATDAAVSKPLTGLRGTHVAGGAALWLVGDLDYLRERGFRPLGMEPVAVGVSADADHIITPSVAGPTAAIEEALAAAGVSPAEMATWDLHATATPGDYREVETLRAVFPASVLVTARKGTFGHGMAAGGGWELTAQYLGYERGRLYPTPLARGELNREIAAVHDLFVFDEACAAPRGPAGKLSMGIGGINACVISRPWGGQSLQGADRTSAKSG